MIKLNKLNPFGRMCVTLGMIPSSYKESLTYEEQLLWFMRYLEEVVIPAYNNNVDAIEELQTLYEELKSYVDHYFDNLDVQEEINNKLDDMAESGELEEIITSYLVISGVLAYDNVSDMKSATNLINGSICKTLGYYSKNDGGGAYYKVRTITNDDVVDESYIIALNDDTLIGELIIDNKKISLLQLGCKPDGSNNCTTILYNTIKKFKDGGEIYIPTGSYTTGKITVDFTVKNLIFRGQGFNSYLNNTGTDWTIEFSNYVEDILFDNCAIWCNNSAKGIKTNTDSSVNARIRLNNFKIRNTTNGLLLNNVAYFESNNSQIGVTNSNDNVSNNYALTLEGIEYNTFDTTSFNADTTGSTFPLVIIKKSNCDTFINCEFAKSDIGIKIDTTNASKSLSNITIDKCKFAFVGKCVYGYVNTKSIVNLKITNNVMYSTGTSSNDRCILFEKENNSTQSLQNILIENNLFNKESGTSPSYCIECTESILLNSSILNNRSMFNTNNYLNIGSNVLAQFSDMNTSQIRTATITGNGSTTEFTIYNNDNALPIILGKTPYFMCNIPDLAIPYSVKTYYENSLQLRGKINFATAPAAGSYTVYYTVKY